MTRWKFRFPCKDDQLVSFVFVLALMIGAGIYFWLHSVSSRGTIDFESLPARKAEFLINVNQADWPEFSNLPGIGEKLAKQIVEHRKEHGPFASPEHLMDVSGIGKSKLKAMKPHLFVRSSNVGSSTVEPSK